MSFIQIQDPYGLGQGISSFGSSIGRALREASSRAFEKKQQEELFERQRNLQEEERLRQQQQEEAQRQMLAQSGTTLANVLGQNPSPQQFIQSIPQLVAQGVPLDLIKLFGQQYEPLLKSQLQEQQTQEFWRNLGLLGSPSQMGTGVSDEIQGPEGTIYENIDNVPNNYNQEQINLMLSSQNPGIREIGKSYNDLRKENRRNWESDRDFHAKSLVKVEEKIEELRDSIPRTQRILDLAKGSIESGDVGRLSINQIANTIGGPIGDILRTKSGAQFALAAKENLISNLGDVSARAANMFMEKRILDAFAKVGQSEAANLAVNDFLQTENDLKQAFVNAYDKLAQQDQQTFGYKRNDLSKRARQAAQEEEQKILNRSSLRQQSYIEKEKGVPWMYKQANKKVDKGTPLTPEMFRIFIEKVGTPEKALIRAKQLGYSILSPSQVQGSI